jgi:hypothetical protein
MDYPVNTAISVREVECPQPLVKNAPLRKNSSIEIEVAIIISPFVVADTDERACTLLALPSQLCYHHSWMDVELASPIN